MRLFITCMILLIVNHLKSQTTFPWSGTYSGSGASRTYTTTVSGITTAGLILPLLASSGVNPNLLALSIGAGSMVLSHVNDAGFWLYKEYFGVSIKDSLRTWTIMETILAVVGLLGVLGLELVL